MTNLVPIYARAEPLFRGYCNGMIPSLLARPLFLHSTRRGPLFLSAVMFFLSVRSDNCRGFITQNEERYQAILARTIDMVLHGEMILGQGFRSNSLHGHQLTSPSYWQTLNSMKLRTILQWRLPKKATKSGKKKRKSEDETSTEGKVGHSPHQSGSSPSTSGPGDTSAVALGRGRTGHGCCPADYEHVPDWDW